MNWTRVDAVARELAATRAEVLGLAMLLVGGVLLTWVVVHRPVGQGLALPTPGPAASVAGPLVPTPAATTQPPTSLVHVTGAVRRPGVVRLAGGARVVDAIAAAGGATRRAAPEALNLARVVADGEQVHVPTAREVADGARGPDAGLGVGPPATTSAATAAPAVDLNTATATQLEALPGIGPVLAQRIVEWRDAHGGFAHVGQLREVSGIGEATFQDIAPLARVG